MYAVIESGSKQYRVELGNEIEVDRLDVEPGQTIQIERVLLIADGDDATIGRPLVEGALVNADVLRQDRGEKLIVFKYKPKARTRVKHGHRADLTVLRISEIALNGKSAAKEAAAAAAEQKAIRDAAAKDAAAKAAADRALAAKLAPEPKAAAKAPVKAKAATKTTAKAKAESKPAAARTPTSRTQAGDDKTTAAAGKATVTKTKVSKGATKGATASKTSAAKDSAPKAAAKPAADASDKSSTKKDG
jgi:large subunit ribosomal protein L21